MRAASAMKIVSTTLLAAVDRGKVRATSADPVPARTALRIILSILKPCHESTSLYLWLGCPAPALVCCFFTFGHGVSIRAPASATTTNEPVLARLILSNAGRGVEARPKAAVGANATPEPADAYTAADAELSSRGLARLSRARRQWARLPVVCRSGRSPAIDAAGAASSRP